MKGQWEMTKEQALNYLKSSGMSKEQIQAIVEALGGSEIPIGLTTKNDLGVDAILRAEAQTKIEMNASRYSIAKERGGMGQVEWSDQLIKVSDAVDIIRNLPSVTPQEPKTGHWIDRDVYDADRWKCSECGRTEQYQENFCPNCGAKMVEPQKSEG